MGIRMALYYTTSSVTAANLTSPISFDGGPPMISITTALTPGAATAMETIMLLKGTGNSAGRSLLTQNLCQTESETSSGTQMYKAAGCPHLLRAPHALPHVGHGGHGGGLNGPARLALVMLRKTESSSLSKSELHAKSSSHVVVRVLQAI